MWPAISISDKFFIPTWIVIVSLTSTLAVFWWSLRARARELNYRSSLDIAWLGLLGMMIGGRLPHVLLEDLTFYQQRPWNILRFWEGGLVYYGGLLTALTLILIYLRLKHLNWRPWLDALAPIFAFSYAFGRVGCFLNGCCYGKLCSFPWGVRFTHHADFGLEVLPRHPTQLYASFWEFGALVFLLWLERRPAFLGRRAGVIFLSWVALHSLGRIGMEIFRDDPRGPKWMNLSLGIWVSVILLLVAAVFLLKDFRPSRERKSWH